MAVTASAEQEITQNAATMNRTERFYRPRRTSPFAAVLTE
jgi:hypothetical protein